MELILKSLYYYMLADNVCLLLATAGLRWGGDQQLQDISRCALYLPNYEFSISHRVLGDSSGMLRVTQNIQSRRR